MILSNGVLNEFSSLSLKTQKTILRVMNNFNKLNLNDDFTVHFYGNSNSIKEVCQKGISTGTDLIEKGDPLLYIYSNSNNFKSKFNNQINFVSISNFIKLYNIKI